MNFKIHIAALFIALVTAGFSAPAFAQAAPAAKDPVIAKAVQLLGQKKYSEACDAIDSKYASDTKDVAALFLRGRCLMGLKKYDDTVKVYKRLAKISPDSDRVKEELKKAELLAKPRRNWFARAETSLIYDTNANSGPQNNEILIDGNPVLLGSSSNPVDTAGYSVSGFWGYLHSIGGTNFLLTKVSAEHTDYFTPGDYAFDSYSFSVGPVFSQGDTRLSVAPGYTWQSYGGDAYANSVDMNIRASQKFTPDLTGVMRLAGVRTNYLTSGGRDGFALSTTPGIEAKLNDKTNLNLSLISRFDNTQEKIYSSTSFGYRIALDYAFTDKLKANGNFQKSRRHFDSPDLAFGSDSREDNLSAKSVGLSWDISDYVGQNLSLNLKYQFVNNKSNLSVYTYDRQTTTFSISKSW